MEKTIIPKRICVCRKCSGTGMVTEYDSRDIRRKYPHTRTCPQCNGSGRVYVCGEVRKFIEPYEPATNSI